jgi:adenylate kinase
MTLLNIILFGAPGSGKGTQSKMLASDFNLFHLSTGDLLREVKNDIKSPFYSIINEKMSKGELVNDEILFGIVTEKIKQIQDEKRFKGIIFDGFPRNVSQAKFLSEELQKLQTQKPFIFNFQINHKEVIDRILNRFTCAKCGEVYNKISKIPKNPQICDACGSENSFLDRVDDTPDIIQNRLNVFEENMSKLKTFYGKDLIEINASLNPADIYNILKKTLENSKKL